MSRRRHESMTRMAVTVFCVLAQGALAFAEGPSWNFESDAIGGSAPGFTEVKGRWRVAEDATAPSGSYVLAQESENAGSVFNLVLVDGIAFADVDVSVRLRAVAGREDQGGGVVWRAKDAGNYYVARYNPLEDNFRVYTVKDGERRMLKSVSAALDHKAWHTVRATMRGDHIECYLDGTRSMDVDDDTFVTEGRVGLWTKADAQTHFDDLAVLHGDPAKENLDVFFKVPAKSRLPLHWHTSAERMVLVAGELQVTYDSQKTAILKPGTAVPVEIKNE